MALPGPKGTAGALSPALAKLAKPAVRSQPEARQAAQLSVAARGPGSLMREGGRIVVNVRFESGAIARLDGLRQAGGRVRGASRRYQTATVAVAPADLRELARAPGVAAVWPSREPVTFAHCEGGAVISEGLGQLKVDDGRAAFGLRGAGITVGILSDTFDIAVNAADGSGPVATHGLDDIVSGDLPGPVSTCSGQQKGVDVLEEGPQPRGDEGRAMAQIVHDLAPHAGLAFATAFESEEGFAENIERLAQPVGAGGAGAEVIVDDVAYFEEPFFQDGPVAVAATNVSEEGVTYLTAAGNDNLFDSEGRQISSWEAPEYRDSGSCPEAVVEASEKVEEAEGETPVGLNPTHCMDFDPGLGTDETFFFEVEAGETLTVDLQWAEPWNGVATDLDAFLLDPTGEEVVAASIERNSGEAGTQRPVEILQWENKAATDEIVRLVVNRFSGATDPRLKFILLQNGGGVGAIEYAESEGGDVVGPSIYGHAGTAAAISVAAVPFLNSSVPEPYSSRGPVTHYFAPVSGPVSAEPLPVPEVLAKPDVAATDCGATTFFAFLSGANWRFCGTSAAAPHAAAVAALLRQANPNQPAAQIRQSLVETAVPVGPFGPEAVGSGLVDALAALQSLPEPIEANDPPSEHLPPDQPEQPPKPPNPQPPPAVAPNTSIKRHPPKVVRTARRGVRLGFRFAADRPVSGFLCKVDRGAFHACGAKFVRHYALGDHTVRVRASGVDGLIDPTAAVFRFRVEQLR